jgi:hypothetical protein
LPSSFPRWPPAAAEAAPHSARVWLTTVERTSLLAEHYELPAGAVAAFVLA